MFDVDISKGYVDMPVPEGIDLVSEIERIKREKNAVVLAHYYQSGDLQDIADYVGDSLALAQWAAKTDASILVLCGVHFMGETAKIICPDKKVLIPDMNAGCSLADSCPVDAFAEFVKAHPGYKSFPADEKIIFGPDKNLGNYINSITGRDMLLWDGACHVHSQFSLEKIVDLKKQYPDALILAHPECKRDILLVADKVGSTAALLRFATQSDCKRFIVATESGILHEMKKNNPDKEFIPAPPNDSTCACNECNFMRLNTMKKLYNTLKYELPEVIVDKEIAEKAIEPIQRMLDISASLGI